MGHLEAIGHNRLLVDPSLMSARDLEVGRASQPPGGAERWNEEVARLGLIAPPVHSPCAARS